MSFVLQSDDTYHRFVNTTPKPRATKKSSGELVGPPPPPPPLEDGVGAGADPPVAVGADDIGEVEERGPANLDYDLIACLMELVLPASRFLTPKAKAWPRR